ncbi:MAG: PBSX family phage terminase large subunit [Bacteroidaceae bacterium]|nr:PBSX family phage terminase large subunit [Bacteroidaceae bacterium]
MVVNYKKLNPNGFYCLQFYNDETIRYIVLYGGSSSGKSYSVAETILIQTIYDGENTLVMRKVGASILKTIYEDFKVAAKTLCIDKLFRFTQNSIRCIYNGAKIDFSGLDDPEKIKGISNYKRVQLEEFSEFEIEDFKQIRKRLRGKRGQQIIMTFNPISEMHWIKKDYLDKEKLHDIPMEVVIGGQKIPENLTKVKRLMMNEPKNVLNVRTKEIEQHPSDTVVIQSTYLNNFWVVGSPDGKYGFYDEQCIADFEKDRLEDPDYYNVYALGEWGILRTGSEFFGSFNKGKHMKEVCYNDKLPVHISVDSNVLPYISISYWQIDLENGGKRLWQFNETTAENPNNTVRKAARIVADRLHGFGYTGKVYLHGDASTKSANNIDDEKRSFHDLFISTLNERGVEVEDVIGNSNPSVAMSGEFINAIFDGSIPGLSITIGDKCRVSMEDYQSVQKDANGGILKTRVKNKMTMQTYEEHGHLSDTFRYVVCDLMKEEFISFSNKRKRNLYARDGFVTFYNPSGKYEYSDSLCYVMPNVNGRFLMIYGNKCGELWHITDIVFAESVSTDSIKSAIDARQTNNVVIECSDAYFNFVREMRESSDKDIRVIKEFADIDSRISATSDYVRTIIRFNEQEAVDNIDYGRFLTSLYDYNKDSQNKEASTILSGFIQYVVKQR